MTYSKFLNLTSCYYLGGMLATLENLGLLDLGVAECDLDDDSFILYLHLEANDEKYVMTRRDYL